MTIFARLATVNQYKTAPFRWKFQQKGDHAGHGIFSISKHK